MLTVEPLTRRLLVLAAVCLAGACATAPRPAPPSNVPSPPSADVQPRPAPIDDANGGQRLIAADDFEYLGYWDIALQQWTQGMALRRVNGDLRFLVMQTTPQTEGGRLDEYSTADRPFGSRLTQRTARWPNIYQSRNYTGRYFGLWWEESKKRLWMTMAEDYVPAFRPTQIFTRTIGAENEMGPIVGPVALGSLGHRLTYGGVQPVPEWFQARYRVGPYAAGFGGYASIITSDVSLGLVLHAFPDPETAGLKIGGSQVKALANHKFAAADWYGSRRPHNDRQTRLDAPANFYDGGFSGIVGQPPTREPPPRARWRSPAPDGKGRWTWGDSHWQTGVWIDTPTRKAFLTVPSLRTGRNWYSNSTLHSDGRTFELHLFDPAHLGESAAGRRDPSDVQPYSMTPLSLPGVPLGPKNGSGPNGMATAAAFDATDNRLYVMGTGVVVNGAEYVRIFAYQLK